MLATQTKQITCRVLDIRHLTDSAAAVRIERNGLDFEPGQYIRVGLEGVPEIRDYSVYSGTEAPFLELLVRRIQDGFVSRQLCDLQAGETVGIEGPYGHFKLTESTQKKPLLFVATGTGISPFHSFAASCSNLDFHLLHGTAFSNEAYESAFYGHRYTHCVSREPGGDFSGRVTDYLKARSIAPETHAFLCGNCDMIYETFDLLQEKGLSPAQIHTEVYF